MISLLGMRCLLTFSVLIFSAERANADNASDGDNGVPRDCLEAPMDCDDDCRPDVKVQWNKKLIKTSEEKTVTLYCKFFNTSGSIEVRVIGNWKLYTVNDTVNFGVGELGIQDTSFWNKIHLELRYESRDWIIFVSVNGTDPLKKKVVSTIYETLKQMSVSATGPSDWKFETPGEHCDIDHSPDLRNTTYDNKTVVPGPRDEGGDALQVESWRPWIFVIVLLVVILVIAVITSVVVYKIRHPKTLILPRVNLEMGDAEVQARANGIGPRDSGERPGSAHESENSLYGVL